MPTQRKEGLRSDPSRKGKWLRTAPTSSPSAAGRGGGGTRLCDAGAARRRHWLAGRGRGAEGRGVARRPGGHVDRGVHGGGVHHPPPAGRRRYRRGAAAVLPRVPAGGAVR